MPTLALAGGTSPGLGRAIVSTLLSSSNHHQWDVVILSRNSRAPLWLRAIDQDGARTHIRPVDYLSVESLTTALKGIHTVISVTSAMDGMKAQIQINLVKAAVQAACKRFAPSRWGFGPRGWEDVKNAKESIEGIREICMKHKDKIECANFNQGYFMNYIGLGMYPAPSEVDEETSLYRLKVGGGYMAGEDQASEGLLRQGDLKDGSGAFLIGLKNTIAELPTKDDGSWPRITMTTIGDTARFVVASLELPKWKEEMTMVGETLTMGELLAHAEAVTGSKLQVDLVKIAELQKRLDELAEDDFLPRIWTEFKIANTWDLEDVGVLRPVVNQLCPAVKPIGVREYMEKFWRGA
ncbi:hypothetical protein K505DRAFT_320410 [Melanomma pulvis-pyrius CBS 109.77]|uniref:NmrA-like domain-containing protein n=1 Tax=Melanomma pulvis-pyrius CBS 109.77 TaxID=1314802 RepID=A0A6A6XW98_9PLEO|nr:hypothetical protein K505DRAFT_320410 [Melanomma pulvis-pyrius CBS 109.77]